MIHPHCPHCGQPIAEVRDGVRLPPLKAAIYDAIKRAGDEGVSSLAIVSTVYQGRREPHTSSIKSHITQINDALEETDMQIVSDRRGYNAAWRLQAKPKQRV
jgi:tyrosine-protein phosphatase YwqE